MKAHFFMLCPNQVVDNVGARSVPPRVAEPLAAGRHVAPGHASGVVDPAVPAGVLDKIALAIVVPIIPGAGSYRLLEAESGDPGGEAIGRGRRARLGGRPRRRRGGGGRRGGGVLGHEIGVWGACVGRWRRRGRPGRGRRGGGGDGGRQRNGSGGRLGELGEVGVIEVVALRVELEEGVGIAGGGGGVRLRGRLV